jgi:hypothetical protein
MGEEKCPKNFDRRTRREEITLGSRHRWEDNIKRDLQATRWEGVDWIDLAQDSVKRPALVNTVMNLRVS